MVIRCQIPLAQSRLFLPPSLFASLLLSLVSCLSLYLSVCLSLSPPPPALVVSLPPSLPLSIYLSPPPFLAFPLFFSIFLLLLSLVPCLPACFFCLLAWLHVSQSPSPRLTSLSFPPSLCLSLYLSLSIYLSPLSLLLCKPLSATWLLALQPGPVHSAPEGTYMFSICSPEAIEEPRSQRAAELMFYPSLSLRVIPWFPAGLFQHCLVFRQVMPLGPPW